MNGADLLWMLQWAHGLLERRVADCPDDAFYAFLPNASIASIAAIYAHAVLTEDNYVHRTVRGTEPLFESPQWAGRLGFEPKLAIDTDWARGLRLNRPEFDTYAADVFAASEASLRGITKAELSRQVTTPLPVKKEGRWTFEWMQVEVARALTDQVIFHTIEHASEIAALRGVQGV